MLTVHIGTDLVAMTACRWLAADDHSSQLDGTASYNSNSVIVTAAYTGFHDRLSESLKTWQQPCNVLKLYYSAKTHSLVH